MEVSEVSKFFVINANGTLSENDQDMKECHWDPPSSKRLISLITRYRDKVGTSQVKTLKHMWVIISQELSQELNMKISPNHAENRWRVLERNYKKYLEYKNGTTGPRRRFFAFAEEMAKVPRWIYWKRNEDSKTSQDSEDVQNPKVQCSVLFSDDETPSQPMKDPQEEMCQIKKKQIMKQKMREMERMRLDRLQYQRQKLKLLETLANHKNNLIRERNEILKQRNEILKNSKCPCMKENA